ncbi:cation:proton antiporter [Streptomyces sp. NPDC058872]|uniref:cation:proton antiporter n=1 Tax=Streptomyces sp. NPDC058872 TaxID=3346661 RepID=UPI0036961FD5
MDVLSLWPRIPHAVAVLGVVAPIAYAGRWAARLVRQPVVVGEVTLGLLAGPAALALVGRLAFDTMLPEPVLHLVGLVAEAGLVFYLGAAALAVALTMKDLGMTAILGAAVVGFAVPGGGSEPWTRVVTDLSRAGRALVPTFFVVSGIALLDDVSPAASWTLIAWTIALGCLGKGVGSYVGARLDGRPPRLAGRIAILMNTRGLTELVVVQAGYTAGVLSAAMMLGLTAMALVTTAMTGPLLDLLDRGERAPRAEPLPLTTTESSSR